MGTIVMCSLVIIISLVAYIYYEVIEPRQHKK